MKQFSLIATVLMLTLQLGCSKDPAGISTGTIKGKIIDSSTNTAISGVVVSTSPASSAVTSDDSGYYQIDEVNAGAYTILAAKSGYDNASASISVEGGKVVDANLALAAITAAPAIPVLVTPVDSIINVILQPAFNWNPTSGASSYSIQIAKDSSFTVLTAASSGLYYNSFISSALAESTTYYWRVNARNSIGISAWSQFRVFTTGSLATGNTRPNQPTTPIGTTFGYRSQSYGYDFTCTDPDGDQIFFRADWGDGTPMVWNDSYSYGWYTYTLSHFYKSLGTFPIRIQAMDIYGDTSLWSASTSVTIMNSVPVFYTYYVSPYNGSTCYYTPISFDWDCTDQDLPYDTLSYDMYLDTLNPPVQLHVSGLTASQYYLNTIANSKIYYWKIVAKDGSGDSTTSPVWSFYKSSK